MAINGSLGAVFIQTDKQVVACDYVGYDPNAQGAFDFIDAPTTANTDRTRYTIANPEQRYWSKNYTVTVKKNGGAITTGYTIEYPGGVVVFDAALSPGDIVTVSGKYLTLQQAGGCFNWSLDAVGDIRDATMYESIDDFREKMQTLNSFVATADQYWWTGDYAEKLGNELVLVLYVDSGNDVRLEGFAFLNENSVDTSVDTIIEENIGFQGVGPVYYRGD